MHERARITIRVLVAAGIFATGYLVQPVLATSGSVDFDDHWLAAACVPSGPSRTVMTNFGPAVELPTRSPRTELLCNIDADAFHNWLQFWAEDNSPSGQITVTLYRQNVTSGALAAPEALISASTVDVSGPQVVELFDDFDQIGDLNEFVYLYYLSITMERETADGVLRVYNASLRDVL